MGCKKRACKIKTIIWYHEFLCFWIDFDLYGQSLDYVDNRGWSQRVHVKRNPPLCIQLYVDIARYNIRMFCVGYRCVFFFLFFFFVPKWNIIIILSFTNSKRVTGRLRRRVRERTRCSYVVVRIVRVHNILYYIILQNTSWIMLRPRIEEINVFINI